MVCGILRDKRARKAGASKAVKNPKVGWGMIPLRGSHTFSVSDTRSMVSPERT